MPGDSLTHAEPRHPRSLVPAQVPRRFPVGTLLLLVLVFAVVLSVLRTVGMGAGMILFVGGFVLVVGLGQVVLFRGEKPREASLCAGVAAWILLGTLGTLAGAWSGAARRWETVIWMLFAIVFSAFLGAALGYITGCVLAGVFLVADRIRTGQWNRVREAEPALLAVTVERTGPGLELPQPLLETSRLRLRRFTLTDAADVQHLADDPDVASTTSRMPHPYENGMAESWISTHEARYRAGEEAVFAVARKDNGSLIGAIRLKLVLDQARAEMGYWIGKSYWGRGYATEAAWAVIQYGFEQLDLIAIGAHHMSRNPASGRVMQKIGMAHVRHLPQFIEKNGVREDVEAYEIMRHDYRGSDGSLAERPAGILEKTEQDCLQ